jgi:hypothetical protein
MRLLFLYYDAAHAEPVLRCREAFESHDILLDSRQVFQQHAKFLGAAGSSGASEYLSIPCDVILIHHQIMGEEVAACGKPVIILERIDGAQLETRHWLPNVAGILKNYVVRPRELNNQYRGRICAHLLRDAGAQSPNTRAMSGTPQQLTQSEFDKVQVIHGFGSVRHMVALSQQYVDLDAPRSMLLQFRGHQTYKETEMEWHRRKAADAVNGLANIISDRVLCGPPIPHSEYCREMWRSKTVLSPWGWGEACYRDYEAMLMGAVLIKPDTDYVEGWPDVFRSGETYVKCALDFSDIPGIVLEIDANWEKYRPMRERARALALEATSTAAIASRIVDCVRRLVA